ncbi:hypothetical protein LPTSP2_04530 [Leptospira ellinghausenii]|uniref:Uncharacterized protein n=1 Tax=Leptospira ellinghausenii TaxID=1917822 RepID=A0A2P2D993_9LEPT|nr:hypothetical protein LPTSP2_04530 [Leptospira ellinghausenii]
MKQYKIPIESTELPNWKFYCNETSYGVYHCFGLRNSGNEVSCYGEDYNGTFLKCVEFAKSVEENLKNNSDF